MVAFATTFLNKDFSKIKVSKVDREKQQFTSVVSYINKNSAPIESRITREQIIKTLQIPAIYYVNRNYITEILSKDNNFVNIDEEVFVLSVYPQQQSVIEATKECIEGIRKTNRKIILTSHYPIPTELQSLVDYCVYDSNNILTKIDFYGDGYCYDENFEYIIKLKEENNNTYHGPAVYTNYYVCLS